MVDVGSPTGRALAGRERLAAWTQRRVTCLMNDNQDPRTRFGADMLINALLLHPGRVDRLRTAESEFFLHERDRLEQRLNRPDVPIDVRDYALSRIRTELTLARPRPEDEDLGGAEAAGY